MRKEPKISGRFENLRLDEEPNLAEFVRNLAENELKGKSITAIRQAIMKVESGSQTMPPLYLIKAYCKHFNVTSDYLLGIRDVPTTDEDIAMICKYTGLSEESIFNIESLNNEQKLILESFINSLALKEMTTAIEDWYYSMVNKITIISDRKEHEISDETRKKINEYLTTESAKQIFHLVSHAPDVTNYYMNKHLTKSENEKYDMQKEMITLKYPPDSTEYINALNKIEQEHIEYLNAINKDYYSKFTNN